MLVMSRKRNESLVIGRGSRAVRVMVTEIRGDKVRLGVEAPKDTPVNRDEVYEDIVRQGGETFLRNVLLENVGQSFTAFRDLAQQLGQSDGELRRSLAADLVQLAQWLSPSLAEKEPW